MPRYMNFPYPLTEILAPSRSSAEAFLSSMPSEKTLPFPISLEARSRDSLNTAATTASALSEAVTGKEELDRFLAGRVRPLLPAGVQERWDAPSMYGRPDRQTVGMAAVSFLLRPCAFAGRVVFGRREGTSPTFTAPERWLGAPLPTAPDGGRKLVKKFLHCYGPAHRRSLPC